MVKTIRKLRQMNTLLSYVENLVNETVWSRRVQLCGHRFGQYVRSSEPSSREISPHFPSSCMTVFHEGHCRFRVPRETG